MSEKNAKLIRLYVAAVVVNPAAPQCDYNDQYFKRPAMVNGQMQLVKVMGTRKLKPFTVRAVTKTIKKMVKRGELTMAEIKQQLTDMELI